MKKFIKLTAFFVLLGMLAHPAYAADQWTKGDPQGTEASGTIDDIIRINNEATDRLLISYKRGLGVNYVNASALSVLVGEVAIPNAAGSIVKWRRTTTATSITWSDIDTGSEASATQYYLYATADTDITGVVFKISASASAPSGSTYYRAIGQFYNNASGNIENLISYRPDYGTDYPDVVEGWVNFTGTGTVTINDQYNVSSVIDNGTGDYTINWATPFANAYYSVSVTGSESTHFKLYGTTPLTTSSARVVSSDASTNANDSTVMCVIATGDRV